MGKEPEGDNQGADPSGKGKQKHTPRIREGQTKAEALAVVAAKAAALQKQKDETRRLKNLYQTRLKQVDDRIATQKLFKLRYTEGADALRHLVTGKSKEVKWEPEDENKIMELVAILSDPTLASQYHTPDLLCAAVGITRARWMSYKHSYFFQKALVTAIRGEAMLGVAKALPTQVQIASDPDKPTSSQAFRALAQVAGAESDPEQKKSGAVNINLTFEQNLRELVSEGPKIVDERSPDE